jgi:hypothetical protein
VFRLKTSLIFDRQGQTAICHSSEDWLLQHMDVKKESQFMEISYTARVRIGSLFNIKSIV